MFRKIEKNDVTVRQIWIFETTYDWMRERERVTERTDGHNEGIVDSLWTDELWIRRRLNGKNQTTDRGKRRITNETRHLSISFFFFFTNVRKHVKCDIPSLACTYIVPDNLSFDKHAGSNESRSAPVMLVLLHYTMKPWYTRDDSIVRVVGIRHDVYEVYGTRI